jgi:hypothetical protein
VTLTLDAAARGRILDFVRPLSVSLDGVTNFGYVERRLRAARNLLAEARRAGDMEAAGETAADEDRLFLLAAFAGLPGARRISPDSREDLLLRSLQIPFEEIRRLVSSLSRYDTDPRTAEEMLVHDAALLESVGAYGVTQLLVSGSRERQTLAEMAGEIAEKMAGARFATAAGRRLAADRIAFATLFAKKLGEEAAEFEAPPSPG